MRNLRKIYSRIEINVGVFMSSNIPKRHHGLVKAFKDVYIPYGGYWSAPVAHACPIIGPVMCSAPIITATQGVP